jgi:nicotinic acid phosphoribosyltransferase
MFRSITRVLAGVGALAALALGGSALAGAATSSSSSTTPQSSSTARPRANFPANFPAHGTAAHEDAEKAVTGDAAAKAQAAAVKSVGGGTAGAVTTDFTGNGFEVTVTKTDGTKVEVHLDSSYNVVHVPGGGGGPPRAGYGGQAPGGGPPPGGAGGQPPAGY